MPASSSLTTGMWPLGETFFTADSSQLSSTVETDLVGKEFTSQEANATGNRHRRYVAVKNMSGSALSAYTPCAFPTTAGYQYQCVEAAATGTNTPVMGIVDPDLSADAEDGDLFWMQTDGPTTLQNQASGTVAAGDPVASSATAGRVTKASADTDRNKFARADAAAAVNATFAAYLHCRI